MALVPYDGNYLPVLSKLHNSSAEFHFADHNVRLTQDWNKLGVAAVVWDAVSDHRWCTTVHTLQHFLKYFVFQYELFNHLLNYGRLLECDKDVANYGTIDSATLYRYCSLLTSYVFLSLSGGSDVYVPGAGAGRADREGCHRAGGRHWTGGHRGSSSR